MAYEIPVFKAERDLGLATQIKANASVGYLVPLTPLSVEDKMAEHLKTCANEQLKAQEGDFDLFFLRDILVTTGWNKNTDIFDCMETWAARHTPEHKPFNFEHNQTDIIGHITASHAVDDDMGPIDDNTVMDELPKKFHIVNGSVIYRAWSDEGRQKLVEQTIAEIQNGEWYVSMECLFRGFDYGVIGPDGGQRVIARNETSAFLTKHLRQYGGTGVYHDSSTGSEFTIGRVLRNITFSGKGLVRKPANPESVIFNSAAAFDSIPAELGYITSGAVVASTETEESPIMAETNLDVQVLQNQINDLTKRNETLAGEIVTLKSKDTEVTIAGLNKKVSDHEATIAERDKTINDQNVQINALKESSATVVTRAETAEASLATAQSEITALKASEQKRNRHAVLVEKGAKPEVADKLSESFASLDDAAFNSMVDVLSEGWKTPKSTTQAQTDAINNATVEPDAALATDADTAEAALAETSDYFGGLLHNRKSKTSTKD